MAKWGVSPFSKGSPRLRNRGYRKRVGLNPSQRTAVLGSPCVFGILFCESRKIPSCLQLLQYVVGFGARLIHRFLIDFAIRSWQRFLDQNLPDIDLLGDAIFFAMLLVVALQILLCNLRLR